MRRQTSAQETEIKRENASEQSGSRGEIDDLRRERETQLGLMSQAEFVRELEFHRKAQWRPSSLQNHFDKHRKILEELLGQAITLSDYERLSEDIRQKPNRVFMGIDKHTREITFVFVKTFEGGDVIIQVVTRRGTVRTMFPPQLERWLERHSEMAEVTDRVQQAGA